MVIKYLPPKGKMYKVSTNFGLVPSFGLQYKVIDISRMRPFPNLNPSIRATSRFTTTSRPRPCNVVQIKNTMPKVKSAFYAVRKGRISGIYPTWEECEAQVKGFYGAVYKKFLTDTEARAFIADDSSHKLPSAPPPSSTITPFSHTVPSISSNSVPNTPSLEQDELDCDVVYSDGSCKGNGKAGSVAGVGAWWGWNDPRNIAERCPGDQTNNRAELIAIVRILESTPFSHRPLVIKTDSKYSIQCFESWLPKWSLNGFRTANGDPVKNAHLIRYLAALLYARETAGSKVRFKHVKGHVGIEGNECADRLANDGALKPELPERDWAKLTHDMGNSTTSRVIAEEQAKLNTATPRPSSAGLPRSSITTHVSSHPPPTDSRTLSKAELDEYANCLLDADELFNFETDELKLDH